MRGGRQEREERREEGDRYRVYRDEEKAGEEREDKKRRGKSRRGEGKREEEREDKQKRGQRRGQRRGTNRRGGTVLLRSQLNAKLFFRFHKLPLKITEISNFFEEKIEKVSV